MPHIAYNGPFAYRVEDDGRTYLGTREVDPKTFRPMDEPEPEKKQKRRVIRKRLKYTKESLINGSSN